MTQLDETNVEQEKSSKLWKVFFFYQVKNICDFSQHIFEKHQNFNSCILKKVLVIIVKKPSIILIITLFKLNSNK